MKSSSLLPNLGRSEVAKITVAQLPNQDRFQIVAEAIAVTRYRLMHEAATQADQDADTLSFLHAVRVVRRKLPFHAATPLGSKRGFVRGPYRKCFRSA